MAISSFVTLGIGAPGDITPFILVGLEPGALPPSVGEPGGGYTAGVQPVGPGYSAGVQPAGPTYSAGVQAADPSYTYDDSGEMV